MTAYTNTSPIGRLLEELPWMGQSVKAVRGGGRGNENALTVEALQGLHIFVTSAPSCINFGTPEKPEGVLPSWAGHLHYVVSG